MPVSFASTSMVLPEFVAGSTSPTNIAGLLQCAARQHPRSGIRVVATEQEEKFEILTYAALLGEARRILGGLRGCGHPRGANVALLLERPRDIIPAFWACVLGGYVPCPLAPIRNDTERWAKHLSHVQGLLDNPLLVTTGALREGLPSDVHAEDLTSLRAGRPEDSVSDAQPEDPAILMLTSGSTGNSKAVVLTHGNLLASMAGRAKRQRMTSSDTTLNWIAFDHVAALLESHMVALYVGALQIHIEPAPILADPMIFLRLIERYGVSIAFAPNFLLGQITTLLQQTRSEAANQLVPQFTLSGLRRIVTGGEANVVETGRLFLQLLAPHGLAPNVLWPAFGMTETCAASVYSHEFPHRDTDREFASVGLPIEGLEMRIVDELSQPLPDGTCGELQLRGPVVFSHYYNNREATLAAFTADGWFRTGDLGRIEDGRLDLVGRSKDCIIVSGVNYFSHELESWLEPLDGIERSFVAAFPRRPAGADTEQLVVAFATTLALDDEEDKIHQLVTAVRNTTVLLWGFRPALVLPLPKSAFPRTSLGKIQRSLMRKRLDDGSFADHECYIADVMRRHQGEYSRPLGSTETAIAQIFSEIFELDPATLSATSSFFDLGGTSLDILKLKQTLERRLGIMDLPLIQILQNPSIRALANRGNSEYDPIVPLQTAGTKTPLFCIHPGVGEVLVYVALASFFVNERPFYALRARGLTEGEKYFESMEEMVQAYVEGIRKRQPHGPYAIAGYSFGGPVAFEIAKQLELQGERVAFVGCIDETPFLAEPSRRLNGVEGPLHVAFLLGMIDRRQLSMLPHQLAGPLSAEDPLDYLVQIAPRERLNELDLDLPKFRAFAALSRSLVELGQTYTPSGSVDSMTVFYASPLHGAKQDWLRDVQRWDNFSRTPNRYIDVDGEHSTLMDKQNVRGFQAVLRSELDRALGGR